MLVVTVGLLLTLGLALGVMVLVALPNLRAEQRILTLDGERALARARQQAKFRPAAAARRVRRGVVSGLTHRLPVAVRAVIRALVRGSAALHLRISAAWAPISAVLHEGMDRLESRSAGGEAPQEAGGEAPQEAESFTAATDPAQAPAAASTQPVEPLAVGTGSAPASPAVPVVPAVTSAPVKTRGPVRARFDVAAVAGGRQVGRPRSTPAISGPIPAIRETAVGSSGYEGSDGDPAVIDLRQPAGRRGAAAESQDAGRIRHAH